IAFGSVPLDYQFFYSDAPRHALNGAFILDLVRDFPINDPVQWAYNYYAQYPALTILFYPPLYPAILAVAYAILGISQFSAVVVNALFYFALLLGVFRVSRPLMGFVAGAIAAAAVGALPDIAFWGRQVMTDVPATAMLVWGVAFFLEYSEHRRSWLLYASALAVLAAVWLKLTVCFVLPVFAIALVAIDGRFVWQSRRHWSVVALMILGLLPLAWLTLHFGQTNVQSAANAAGAPASRLSLANWLWYPRRLPAMVGWPMTVVFVAGSAAGLVAWTRQRRGMQAAWGLIAGWAIVGYVFFSAIDLKDERFFIPVLPALVVIAVGGIHALLPARRAIWGWLVTAAVAVATLTITWIEYPPLYVKGYARIVRDVAREAPRDSNVVFSGYRDGAFIFAMRAIGGRPDLHTIRADKLLLTIAIRRSAGVKQKNLTEAQIAKELTRQKTSYVVAQDGFWTDLTEMKRLQAVLHSAQFKPVAHYRMQANFNAPERSITVYRNLAKLPKKRPPLSIDLPAINRTVTHD
ncbi:MAG: glycosyltransferase family 39 protein, partial [Salinisphaera sp.]|uniref:ArnT family glycosyltransferase n=1 Tax=Salinisphaera sp. TaxID=1914330 RepID=UPI003C7E1172